MAIANGRLNVVEFLISNGVSLNASNIEKYTLWILQLRDFHMEIIIHATQTQNVLGKKGRKIRELTSVVQKRFEFLENNVELYAEKFNNRVFYAIAQAESLRFKLLGGLVVRRAGYGVLSFVMESGTKGCEVIGGKLHV
uniref:KH type-2 domain-containing protein n=1 Tax=Vitis vinifera TaxID=29760 RepID=F6H8V0_VITVI